MPIAAPSDKRFRRAHVSPRGKHSWKHKAWTIGRVVGIVLVGVYGMYRAAVLFLPVDALVIDKISVSGNTMMSQGEVVALLDDLRGQNMLIANLEGWRDKLKSSPWVADATIRRVLPGTIAVSVVERAPIGIGRIGDQLYLIDRRGAIIDEFGPNYSSLDLPLINGLAAQPQEGGLLVDDARAALATRLLDSLSGRRELAARISEIDVTDVRDALVTLRNDPAVLRVGDDQFLKRLEAYVDLAPTLRERVPSIDYVDLRFDERVYVKPQNGSRTAVSQLPEVQR